MQGSLIDTSVWVASVFPQHPAHRFAERELSQATKQNPACFCRSTQQSFLRLITTPLLLRYYQADGFTNRDALAVYDLLRSKPEIQEIDEPAGTFYLWQRLADRIFAAPKVWMDAYLASFAICGELKLVTLDRDFQNYQDQGLQLQLLAVPSGDSP